MPPKSEREEVLTALTSKIFSSMLDDIVMDAALQAHHEVSRSRAICKICNTRCNAVHTPGPSNVSSQPQVPLSRPATPSAQTKPLNGSSGTPGTSTPTSSRSDGNIYFDCPICSRQVASNRYAPHLSGCMGLGTARRGATRGNVAKPKIPSDTGQSASPTSNAGNVSDDELNIKKGKSKDKRADEAEFNLKRKRNGASVSPQVSPAKKAKPQKSSGSPVSRVKADPDLSLPGSVPPLYPSSSQSKIPSKLRDSSTVSVVDRSPSSSSRSSSLVPSVATPVSSLSGQSPSFSARGPPGRAKGKGPPSVPKRLSPPRPPPPPVQHYMQDDDGGDETGSSTDTDSS